MPRKPYYVARDAALLRLAELYPKDFARLYDEEREARGLKPLSPRRAERIKSLREQLIRLERQEGAP